MFNNLIEHSGGSSEAIIILIIIIICQNCRVCNISVKLHTDRCNILICLGSWEIPRPQIGQGSVAQACRWSFSISVDLFTWRDCGSQMVAKWRESLRDDANGKNAQEMTLIVGSVNERCFTLSQSSKLKCKPNRVGFMERGWGTRSVVSSQRWSLMVSFDTFYTCKQELITRYIFPDLSS